MGRLYQRRQKFDLGYIAGIETRVQQEGRDARGHARNAKCEANDSGQRILATNQLPQEGDRGPPGEHQGARCLHARDHEVLAKRRKNAQLTTVTPLSPKKQGYFKCTSNTQTYFIL